MTLEEYHRIKPKVHFSPNQQFYPDEVYDEAMSDALRNDKPIPILYLNAVDLVYEYFDLPFKPYSYQSAWVNAFADEAAAGMYLDVGLGKTLTATLAALYHRLYDQGHTIVVMPPILINQWHKWLTSIGGVNTVTMYKGTPNQRKGLDLGAEWILMSMDVFKRDFDRIYEFYENKNVTLIVDEAVCVKNPNTQNHKCVWAFQNLDRSKLKPKNQQRKPHIKLPLPSNKQQASEDAVAKLKAMLKERYK